MPLVIVTGLPSSGKTTAIKKIITSLEQKISEAQANKKPGGNLKIILHADESLGIQHDDYRESRTEKSSRGNQMTAVKRDLSRNNIVILDSLCYIKGFRYQLFCEAKSLSTTNCTIQMMAPLEVCLERNASRDDGLQWDPELIKQLEMRYEEPDSRNRWDSPLIGIIYNEDELHIDDIWKALVYPAKKLKPNNATISKQANTGNFLQELDRATQEVVNRVVEYQQGGLGTAGGSVVIQKGDVDQGISDITVELPLKTVSTAQLQRIRRTYISLNRVRAVDTNRIAPLFVEYLNTSLDNDDV
ncbi:Kti12 protein [Saccharomycopsis crataegensis]|uniref:Kti12 protein n=1 Tax=Saccharomycopsis crataegensis TaxID=43959 RepID=A0AAV5QTZ5_9ASCO|nr:Kti12 protein [Saccharomycopsis crataegensis]